MNYGKRIDRARNIVNGLIELYNPENDVSVPEVSATDRKVVEALNQVLELVNDLAERVEEMERQELQY